METVRLECECFLNCGSPKNGAILGDSISPNFKLYLKEERIMSEETKKPETMEDYMNEINASFSNFRDDDMLIWDKLTQMKEDKEAFEVTVEGIVKGGVIAYVEGIRAFIPVSQLDIHYVENPEDYLKKTLTVRVLELDEQENRLVLSAKEVLKDKDNWGILFVQNFHNFTSESVPQFIRMRGWLVLNYSETCVQ